MFPFKNGQNFDNFCQKITREKPWLLKRPYVNYAYGHVTIIPGLETKLAYLNYYFYLNLLLDHNF